MNRISIIGTTGSGKTTLARAVAKRLNLPFTELDSINWQRNWTPLEPEELRERVEAIVWHDRWVIEGGYSKINPMIWKRADTLIWIDYSLPIVLGRLLRRTAHRVLTKEELWAGNRESIGRTLSRESIVIWLFKSYWKKKRQYNNLTANGDYPNLKIHHFRSPSETEKWLRGLE